MDGFYIISVDGCILVERQYTSGVSRWPVVAKAVAEAQHAVLGVALPAVVRVDSAAAVRVVRGDVLFAAVTVRDGYVAFVAELLGTIADNIVNYFTKEQAPFLGRELSTKLIQQNFATVSTLVDEMIDGGLPGILDSNALAMLLPTKSLMGSITDMVSSASALIDPIAAVVSGVSGSSDEALSTKLAAQVDVPGSGMTGGSGIGLGTGYTGCGSDIWWRRGDVTNAKNEIYVDLVESLNCTVGKDGKVFYSSVAGYVDCYAALVGCPKYCMWLKNPGKLNFNFHPSVNLESWKNNETITFIPPEGKFRLMDYTAPQAKLQLEPPVKIESAIRFQKTLGLLDIAIFPNRKFCAIGTQSSEAVTMEGVSLSILLPSWISGFTMKDCSAGTVKFTNKQKLLHWSFPSFEAKDRTVKLSGTLTIEDQDGAAVAAGGVSNLQIDEVVEGRAGKAGEAEFIAAQHGSKSEKVSYMGEMGNKLAAEGMREIVKPADVRIVGNLHFTVRNFTLTGLHIDSLDVRNSDAAVQKLIRSSTAAGHVEFYL